MIFCESSWLPPPPDRFQWMNNLSRIWILRSAEAGPSRDVTHNIRSQDITLYIIHIIHSYYITFKSCSFHNCQCNITVFTFPIPLRVINWRWSQVFAQAGARQKFYKMCPELRSSVRTEEARVNKFQCLPFLYSEPDTKLVKRQKKIPQKISSGHLLFWSKNFVLNLVFRNWHWGNFPNTSLYLLLLRGNIQKLEQKDSEWLTEIQNIPTSNFFIIRNIINDHQNVYSINPRNSMVMIVSDQKSSIYGYLPRGIQLPQ